MSARLASAGLLLGLWPHSGLASAATYHVDALRGNDAWNGLAAEAQQGDTGPWASLARAGRVALKAGDVLALRCDGLWREALRIRGGGSAEEPVRVQPYGQCAQGARPELRPARLVSGWQADRDGTYSAPFEGEVVQVMVDGAFLPRARYPASGLLYARSGVAGTGKGSLGLVDPALGAAPAGREASRDVRAVIRTVGWKVEVVRVARLDGESLYFAAATEYPVRKGAGYYLEGARWMLAGAPGWFADREEGRLYLKLAKGQSPEGRRIEVAAAGPGLHLSGQNNVVVEGLRIRAAGGDGVLVEGGQGIVLRDLEVLNADRDGIAVEGSAAPHIDSNRVRASGRNGISLVRADGAQALGNTVEDTALAGVPRPSNAAIHASRSGRVRIEGNRIRGAAYNGIGFGPLARVVNNVVRDVCLVLDDCGAIYSWTNPERLVATAGEVRGNVVRNVVGGRDGNPDPYTVAAGIYLDDFTSGVSVSGNTVQGAERGIYLHNAFDNRVEDNTVLGSRAYSLILAADHPFYVRPRRPDNRFAANTLVSMEGAPLVYYLDRIGREFTDVMEGNVYLGRVLERGYVVHRMGAAGNSVSRMDETGFRVLPGKARHGDSRRLASAPPLLVNEEDEERAFPCPLASPAACARAIDAAGRPLSWPVRLPGHASLIVVRE